MIRDTIYPTDKWSFDTRVSQVFEDMLARSIPQYEVMRKAVYDIGRRYVQDEGWIVDLGCSRGQAIEPFVNCYSKSHKCLGIEVSEPMRLAAQMRFAGNENVIIRDTDLRYVYPPERATLVLAVLTLQFIPIEYRQRVMQDTYNSLLPDGALVLVEKVLGATARLNQDMADLYYAAKGNAGYSREQIERKRLALEGVLVPVTARMNEEFLQAVGFRQIDCFWRWMNFAGWIAVK